MKIQIDGSGGREAALAKSFDDAGHIVVVWPGNPGILGSVSTIPTDWVPDLVVIGPEQPLVDGAADHYRAQGFKVLGPGADGAQIEGSKVYMKWLLMNAGVPTAKFVVISTYDDAQAAVLEIGLPCAVKTDYLMGGKGVTVAHTLEEAMADIAAKFAARPDGLLVIEAGLVGPEVSVMFVCDGQTAVPLPVARDYKRVGDGDTGPNTGGMGAICPVEIDCLPEIQAMADRTMAELVRRGIDYRGILYFGMILTSGGPMVLEINVRLGDPETQVIVPLVRNLAELFYQAACGKLVDPPAITDAAVVAVTLAAPGYPDRPQLGAVANCLRNDLPPGTYVLHAGTGRNQFGNVTVTGGRVAYVVSTGPHLSSARVRAYMAVAAIDCPGTLICRSGHRRLKLAIAIRPGRGFLLPGRLVYVVPKNVSVIIKPWTYIALVLSRTKTFSATLSATWQRNAPGYSLIRSVTSLPSPHSLFLPTTPMSSTRWCDWSQTWAKLLTNIMARASGLTPQSR